MTDALAEPADRLLADWNTPAAIRTAYRGASLAPLAGKLAELGYEDALVDEASGGLGLVLSDLTELFITLGRRNAPLPLAHTIIARSLLAGGSVAARPGHILLVTPTRGPDGRLLARATPLALAAQFALLDLGATYALVSLGDADVSPCAPGLSLAADLAWSAVPDTTAMIPSRGPLRGTAAALGAATLAGAIAGALDLTAIYAATRKQFGKPIGDFQAIQQQLAVLAEEASAAATAAAIGCNSAGPLADGIPAGIAKLRSSTAAARAAAIAHSIHGAIGFSEEYDLQLFTRRMAEERLAHGGEIYWAERIGQARLADTAVSTLDFVRSAAR